MSPQRSCHVCCAACLSSHARGLQVETRGWRSRGRAGRQSKANNRRRSGGGTTRRRSRLFLRLVPALLAAYTPQPCWQVAQSRHAHTGGQRASAACVTAADRTSAWRHSKARRATTGGPARARSAAQTRTQRRRTEGLLLRLRLLLRVLAVGHALHLRVRQRAAEVARRERRAGRLRVLEVVLPGLEKAAQRSASGAGGCKGRGKP